MKAWAARSSASQTRAATDGVCCAVVAVDREWDEPPQLAASAQQSPNASVGDRPLHRGAPTSFARHSAIAPAAYSGLVGGRRGRRGRLGEMAPARCETARSRRRP